MGFARKFQTVDAQLPQWRLLIMDHSSRILVAHMDQPLSRPVRWRGAIDRAKSAMIEVDNLKNEMQVLLDQMQELDDQMQELRHQGKGPLSKFDGAVVDLMCLQSEYECWTVPENLSDSRLQDKIFKVTTVNLKGLHENSSDLEKFDSDYAYGVLWEAQECNLPKGYGRD